MPNNFDEIRLKFAAYDDDELRRIIYIENAEYETEIVEIAKQELFGRYAKNIWEASDITLKDVILHTDRERLENILNESFNEPFELISNYIKVFNTLKSIEAIDNKDIYISIEIGCADRNCNTAKWKVSGEECNSNEKISLEYCCWNEWLGFSVKNRDLQLLGVERYTACCLLEMTTNGFDEEAIKSSFIDIIEDFGGKIRDKEVQPSDLVAADAEVTFDKIAQRGPEVIKGMLENEECSQIRPWVRYWARAIDMIIWIMLITPLTSIVLIHFSYEINHRILRYLITLLTYVLWIPVEALFLSNLSYTPGKWILNIRIYNKDGVKLTFSEAFYRSWNVLAFGNGLTIPIVNIVSGIMSYSRLTEKGKTKWDEQGKFIVSHKRVGIARTAAAVAIILGVTLLDYFIGR